MRLALAGCSDGLARRLRSTLPSREIFVDALPPGEAPGTCDAVLMASGTGSDGFTCGERVKRLRGRDPSLPILVVTPAGNPEAVIDALDAGADAVLKKPVDGRELRLRLERLVGRARQRPRDRDRVCYGGLCLERLRHAARGPGGAVALTPREYQILLYLMLNPERVVSRGELGRAVWGEGAPSANVLDVHISHLRGKLARVGSGGLVHTVRAVGFLFGSLDDGALSSNGKGKSRQG